MHTDAELQQITISLQAVLGEMTATVRMRCAGPVRIVDGRDSAEADARSDQLRMLDRAGFNNELKVSEAERNWSTLAVQFEPRLSLLYEILDRSSPSRVRFAAQQQRALDCCGPFQETPSFQGKAQNGKGPVRRQSGPIFHCHRHKSRPVRATIWLRPQITGVMYLRNGFPKRKSPRSPENPGDTLSG
jgi:hypothetical protein